VKPGDLVFVRGSSVISDAIRFFDKGEFSHVAVAVSPTHIIEAQYSTRVRIVPMAYRDVEIVQLSIDPVKEMTLLKTAIQHCGKPYNFKAILSLMLRRKVSMGNSNGFICSELVTSILTEIGLWSDSVLISPNELYKKITEGESRSTGTHVETVSQIKGGNKHVS